MKQLFRIAGSCFADGVQRAVFQQGNPFGDVGDVGRFVPLATVGDRGQVRGVGFQQDAFQGKVGQGVGNAGFLVGGDTADSEIKVSILTHAFVHLKASGEGVEDALGQGSFFVSEAVEHFKEGISGFAQVNDDREVAFVCPGELLVEGFFLFLHELPGPITVQPDFTDGCVRTAVKAIFHSSQFVLPVFADGGGVKTDAGEALVWMLVGQSFQGGLGCRVNAGENQPGYTRRDCPCECGLAIGIKGFVVQVGVGVNVNRCIHGLIAFRNRHPVVGSVLQVPGR